MKKRFVELETRTYVGRDFRDYLNSLNTGKGDLKEGDEWKLSVEMPDPEPPKAYPARVYVDPEKIIAFVETFSMEEMHMNPDDPTFDAVDICLDDGLQIQAIISLSDFVKKIS